MISLLKPLTIYPAIEYVPAAIIFRLSHRKKNLSYADCLGYTIALKEKLVFLTGDEAFRHIPHVAFVKGE